MEKRSRRGWRTACGLFTALNVTAVPVAAQENKAPWVLDAFADAASENATEAGSAPVMPTLRSFSTALGQRFVGPSADSPYRSEFDAGLDDLDQPWLNSRALLSFPQSNADTLLFQGNVTHAWTGPNAQPDGGIGVGYRHLSGDAEWLTGVNAFLDDGWSGSKSRGSFGGEVRTAPVGIAMNYYQPYAAGDTGGWRQSAAPGYDYDVRLQIPFVPSATVSVSSGAWAFDASQSPLNAKRLGMTFNPLPYFAFDGRVDRGADATASYTVGFRLTLPLGEKPHAPSPAIFDNQIFRNSSIAEHSLDIIRRDETIPMVDLGGG